METNEIDSKPPSDWRPESSRLVLAVVGKLGEEAAELSQICHRISIQGLASSNPDNAKPNIQALADEIADIRAMSSLAIEYLGLNEEDIRDRRLRKINFKNPWFARLKELEK